MMRSKTTIAIPPGATIKEQLVDRGMSQKEFASRMDMSEKHISKLINGEVRLTPDVAMRLELVLGIPAQFWSNLESIYREKLLKVQAENEMEEDIKIVKELPYSEMAKNNWVEQTQKPEERVFNARKFFEVVHLGLLKEPLIPNIAYRKLGEGAKTNYALLAWAQKAKLEARAINTAPSNIAGIDDLIPAIRRMTMQDPEEFCPELRRQLAACGIAIVFLPHFSGSFLHGATFWDGAKIVLGLTVRGKDADRFWFSFFHEIAHIVYGHISKSEGISEEDEQNADDYAKNKLIPYDAYSAFVQREKFNKASIIAFADEVSIHPGIVVGRLQKEQHLPFNRYSDLKTRYEIQI